MLIDGAWAELGTPAEVLIDDAVVTSGPVEDCVSWLRAVAPGSAYYGRRFVMRRCDV